MLRNGRAGFQNNTRWMSDYELGKDNKLKTGLRNLVAIYSSARLEWSKNSAGVFGEDTISGEWMETRCGPSNDTAMSIRSVSDDAAGEIM